MIDNRIYVCSDCKKLYVHESVNSKLYCPICKKELIERGIKQIDWDKYTKEEKNKLLLKTISTDLHKKNKYTRKEDTPLAWHKFNRYFRVPLSLFYCLANICLYGFDILELVISIFLIMFLIGSFKWEKYAYYGIVSSLVMNTIMSLDIAINNLNGSILISTTIASVLEYIYYSKRKYLFNGKKEDDELINYISLDDFNLNEINQL